MPRELTPPMFINGKLCWDIHSDGPELTFWTSATTFKYAMGLRPRAREDDVLGRELAAQNWAVLELIARDALSSGRVAKTDASKGWQIHHTLDDRAFRELLEKYAEQIRR
jgi:hypothetical protein